MTLSINDTQHNHALHYAACRILFTVLLSVIVMNVIMLSVVMLSVVAPAKILNTHKILKFSKLRFLVKIFLWQTKHFFKFNIRFNTRSSNQKHFLSDFKCFCVARGQCFKTLFSHLLNNMSRLFFFYFDRTPMLCYQSIRLKM